ncbi:unnamed protein product, partial [Ectocarpus fasciculatus]
PHTCKNSSHRRRNLSNRQSIVEHRRREEYENHIWILREPFRNVQVDERAQLIQHTPTVTQQGLRCSGKQFWAGSWLGDASRAQEETGTVSSSTQLSATVHAPPVGPVAGVSDQRRTWFTV